MQIVQTADLSLMVTHLYFPFCIYIVFSFFVYMYLYFVSDFWSVFVFKILHLNFPFCLLYFGNWQLTSSEWPKYVVHGGDFSLVLYNKEAHLEILKSADPHHLIEKVLPPPTAAP